MILREKKKVNLLLFSLQNTGDKLQTHMIHDTQILGSVTSVTPRPRNTGFLF